MKARGLTLLTLGFICAFLFTTRADDKSHDDPTISTTREVTPKEVRQWEVTGPWGGDVRALVAAPDNSELFYLGTSDGQMFRSTDGTRTWQRLKPGLGRRGLSVDSIVVDPRDSRTIY